MPLRLYRAFRRAALRRRLAAEQQNLAAMVDTANRLFAEQGERIERLRARLAEDEALRGLSASEIARGVESHAKRSLLA